MNKLANPSRSLRMQTQSRAAPWRSASSTEDARSYLQARMTLFSRLMFWSIVALLVFLTAMYQRYPHIEPKHNDVIFAGAAVLLGIMAFLWRGLLLRRTLEVRTLYRLDLIYSAGIGSAFATSAVLAMDLRPAGYTTLMYAAFTVFLRAIVVPSSGRRTAIMSTLVFVPVWGAASTRPTPPSRSTATSSRRTPSCASAARVLDVAKSSTSA